MCGDSCLECIVLVQAAGDEGLSDGASGRDTERFEDLSEHSQSEEAGGETALIWFFIVSLLNKKMLRFWAWSEGVEEGPSSVGHPEPFHREVLFPRTSASILSVLSFRELFCIQLVMLDMQRWKLALVVDESLDRESMSWALSV